MWHVGSYLTRDQTRGSPAVEVKPNYDLQEVPEPEFLAASLGCLSRADASFSMRASLPSGVMGMGRGSHSAHEMFICCVV